MDYATLLPRHKRHIYIKHKYYTIVKPLNIGQLSPPQKKKCRFEEVPAIEKCSLRKVSLYNE